MTIADLPAINASLNALSTVFIAAGWFWIRRNVWQRHVPCMIAAIISSTCFLVGYVVYHAHAGEKSSGYSGWLAAIYFPILISARATGVRRSAAGHRHPGAGFSTPMGPAPASRALDDADLALCLGHRVCSFISCSINGSRRRAFVRH